MPIQYALSYPERWPAAIPGIDFRGGLHLDFEVPDHDRFPCLSLAYQALAGGGALPAVLNAANEEAVGAFLDRRVPFTAIPEAIQEVMEAQPGPRLVRELEDVLAADAWARERTREALERRALGDRLNGISCTGHSCLPSSPCSGSSSSSTSSGTSSPPRRSGCASSSSRSASGGGSSGSSGATPTAACPSSRWAATSSSRASPRTTSARTRARSATAATSPAVRAGSASSSTWRARSSTASWPSASSPASS